MTLFHAKSKSSEHLACMPS